MVQSRDARIKSRSTCCRKTKKPTDNEKQSSKKSSESASLGNSRRSVDEIVSPNTKKDEEPTEMDKVENVSQTREENIRPATAPEDPHQNMKSRRKEFLAKKEREQAEREKFVKEMAEKKAAERAEIIKQAKKLILYRKPLCRRINRALLVSECLRELDEQMAFQKTVKEMAAEHDTKYIDLIKSDVSKYQEEERKKADEDLKKTGSYYFELKKQIEEIESTNKKKEEEEFEMERQDQINMNKHLELLKEHEAEEILKKKKRMQQFFKDAIEEKKRFELQFKRQEELEDKSVEVYQNAKARIQKLHKETMLKEKKERERRGQIITERHSRTAYPREALEEAVLRKAIEEQKAAEKEKQKARKDHENAMRAAIKDFQAEAAATKLKKVQEEKDFKVWEMMQRFKRDEYDKQVEAEEQRREKKKKLDYACELQKNMKEKEEGRKRESILEENATDMKAVIEKSNQQILDYAEEVLEESKGVRPLYPILKAIDECKKEMGLLPVKKPESVAMEVKLKTRKGIRCACPKFVPEEKVCFL